jgi:hypothetical protein
VGADNVTVPNPLPTSGIATFTLTTPIAVEAGDTLALYSTSSGVQCAFYGGSTPAASSLVSITDDAPPPAAGQTPLTSLIECSSGCTLNVAASFSQSEDAGVVTSAAPSNATVGDQTLLSSTVTNGGPGSGPIGFTDTVPAGMTIDAAVAGQGTCSTSGQHVTCAITGLAPGQSAPVDVVVTPTAAGTYASSVSVTVSSPLSDPNAANDTGTATVTVPALTPAPVAKCVVPKLKGLKLPFAQHVVQLLGCAAGPVRTMHTKSVHKGLVIRTNPSPGTYASGATIAFAVSSGPRKKHPLGERRWRRREDVVRARSGQRADDLRLGGGRRIGPDREREHRSNEGSSGGDHVGDGEPCLAGGRDNRRAHLRPD